MTDRIPDDLWLTALYVTDRLGVTLTSSAHRFRVASRIALALVAQRERCAKLAEDRQLKLIDGASIAMRRGDAFGCTEGAAMMGRAEELGDIAAAIRKPDEVSK